MSVTGLLLLFAKTSILTFGGGYAMIPLFQNEIVVKHMLMTAKEFANLVALAQVTPGPIGFNSATYVGMVHSGLAGSLSASFGVVIPSFLVALIIAAFIHKAKDASWMKLLLKGVRPCVVGIIASAVVFFCDTSVFSVPLANWLKGDGFGLCWQGVVIFVAVVLLRWKCRGLNPIWSLVLSAFLGWVLF